MSQAQQKCLGYILCTLGTQNFPVFVDIAKQYLQAEYFNNQLDQLIYLVISDKKSENLLTAGDIAKYSSKILENSEIEEEIKHRVECYQNSEINLSCNSDRLKFYASRVLQEYQYETLSKTLLSLTTTAANSPPTELSKIKSEALKRISEIKEPGNSRAISLFDVYNMDIDEFFSDRPGEECIHTGIEALDRHLEGLLCKSISCIMANTGVGKTTLALQIALNVARNYSHGDVFYISLEMSAQELLRKMVTYASKGRVNAIYAYKRKDKITEEQRDILFSTAAKLAELPIFILENTENNTLQEILAQLQLHIAKRNRPLMLIVLDHWHLLNVNYGRSKLTSVEAQNQDIVILNNFIKQNSSRGLILCQPDKISRQKQNGKINMSDMKGSSGLADIAQNFFIINRPEIGTAIGIEKAELSIQKARHGQTGVVDLLFDPKRLIFFSKVEGLEENWR